ncbi:calcium/calmodulin-dependent protein kinase type 1-like [Schistocerca gregaria]|uniref:calcium/calmodulin-dependent protein kinase type 1-like n=1 Tax=Schistocerca gregaria TaxID=7010 RepID=UPI00211DEE8B|nr:calcium/calmodulin-dependent protein kinase type 1-like [Schistocerca gregaria]
MAVIPGAKNYSYLKDYHVGRELGSGNFSVVKCVKKKRTNEEYAAKVIQCSSQSEKSDVLQEVQVMREVQGHPKIIQLIDIYDTKDEAVLILELVKGGELFDRIVENKYYSERHAAQLIYQIASIVSYLHQKNIVHRDLKPENLLFEDKKSDTLKLCDFGLAKKLEPGEVLHELMGSMMYLAPEVLEFGGYDRTVDMYSIGVILYILLCGYPPFEREAGIVDLEFLSPDWDGIADSAKELISNLLSNDPSKRPTADEMLKHPWVLGKRTTDKTLNQTIRKMAMFNTVRRQPGMTMRRKDANTKKPVFNIFDAPSSNEENLEPGEKEQLMQSTNSKKDFYEGVEVAPLDRTSSRQRSDACVPCSDSNPSVMTEVKKDHGTSPSGRRVKNTLSSDRAPNLSKKKSPGSSKRRFADLQEQIKQKDQELKSMQEALAQMTNNYSMATQTIEAMQIELKKNNEHKSCINARVELEKNYQGALEKIRKSEEFASKCQQEKEMYEKELLEVKQDLNRRVLKINVETIVADRLESKKIKELEAQIKELEAQLEEMKKI